VVKANLPAQDSTRNAEGKTHSQAPGKTVKKKNVFSLDLLKLFQLSTLAV
jgi:hypothetical protein